MVAGGGASVIYRWDGNINVRRNSVDFDMFDLIIAQIFNHFNIGLYML